MIAISIYFKKSSDNSFYSDNPFIVKIDENSQSIKLHYDQIENFIRKTIKKVELSKVELFIQLKSESESPPTWYFGLMSLLINGKIFMIHKYTKIDFSFDEQNNNFSSTEDIKFDYIDKKHRRKAKLERISSGIEINPEKLWITSWYSELMSLQQYK